MVSPSKLILPLIATLSLAAGVGAYILTQGGHNAHRTGLSEDFRQWNAVVFPTPIPVSNMPFTNEDGVAVQKNSLQGKWSLIFFGYTYCPDVCPTTLGVMQSAWKKLSPQQQNALQVVMMSVDPQRDTPKQLKLYMDYFNPNFTAFTGNEASLRSIATQLNAVYAKVPRKDVDGQIDESLGYLMDHSANIVILNPKGEYAGFIKPPFKTEQMRSVMAALQN